jgi:hypothetical protein
MRDNPFEVLRLDPGSSEEEVVRQAGRLRQRAHDEAALDAIRQAVQEVAGSPQARLLHALLTHPRPGYQAPELDRFVAAFRRPPQPAGPVEVPPLDLHEFAQLLGAHLAGGLDLTPLLFEPTGEQEPPEEIRRQTAEALWQSLLSDPRG